MLVIGDTLDSSTSLDVTTVSNETASNLVDGHDHTGSFSATDDVRSPTAASTPVVSHSVMRDMNVQQIEYIEPSDESSKRIGKPGTKW